MTITLLFLLCLTVRCLPLRSTYTDFDTYGHLYFAQALRDQSAFPWEKLKLNCWKSSSIRNPFLWNWLVGHARIDQFPIIYKYMNGLLDSLFCVTIYLVADYLFENKEASYLATSLYVFSPIWFSRVSIGSRLGSFTPRLFSEIFVSLFFVFSLIDFGFSKILIFFICTFFCVIVIASSKFGLQALIFLVPLVSIFDQNFLPILSFIFGLIFLVLISKGEFYQVLLYQLNISLDYFERNKKGQVGVGNKNQFKSLIMDNKGNRLSLKKIIWQLLAVNSYTSLLLKLPLLFMVNLIFLLNYNFETNSSDFNIYLPVLFATLIFFIINHPLLLFLGEAERYVSHVSIFVVLASVQLALNYDLMIIFWIIVLYGVSFWCFEFLFFTFYKKWEKQNQDDQEIDSYLQKSKYSKTVLCFPYHNFCIYRVMMCSKHKAIFPLLINPKHRKDFINRFEPEYPYINLKKIDEIQKVTGVNCIIIYKAALSLSGYKNWRPNDSWKKINLNQKTYEVYEKK